MQLFSRYFRQERVALTLAAGTCTAKGLNFGQVSLSLSLFVSTMFVHLL